MRAVILYRPNSESAGQAEDYAADYHRQHPEKQMELVSVDEPNGAEMARLYGVVRYPAILAIADDGTLQQLWQNEHLPLQNEIDFYLKSA